MKLTMLAVPGAAVVILAGVAHAPPAANAAPNVFHQTVAYNWYRGTTLQRHFYGSIRPKVWGDSFGEPWQNISWSYWRSLSATGHGRIYHMTCQPCYATIHFYDAVPPTGYRHFKKVKISGRRVGTYYLHWDGHNWSG